VFWRTRLHVPGKVIFHHDEPDYSIGILGVGFSQPSSPTNSWILEAYGRDLIPAPVYSLTLGRFDSKGLTDGSLMVIGGYDEDQINGPINWIHTSGNIHVQVPMDGIILNGVTIKRQDNLPMQAIIDVTPSSNDAEFSLAPEVLSSAPLMLSKRSMKSWVGFLSQIVEDSGNLLATLSRTLASNLVAKII